MSAYNLALVASVVLIGFAVLALIRRADSIAYFGQQLLLFAAAAGGVYWLCVNRQHMQTTPSVALGFFAGILLLQIVRPRSRHIPARERRRAIARYESRTGEKYNSRKHDIDHEIPFSKGGSSKASNLNVMDRGKNRRKKARSAWWDPFG